MGALATIWGGALAAITFATFRTVPAAATESLERTIVEKLTSERCVSFFVCDPDDSPSSEHDSERRNDNDDSVPAGADEPGADGSAAPTAVRARCPDRATESLVGAQAHRRMGTPGHLGRGVLS